MSSAGAGRQAILDALEAGGIRTATAPRFSAPVVYVEPGDPWAEPVRMGGELRRVSHWRLTAIAGRADTEGAFEELADFIDSVDAALLAVEGCQLPTWAKPADYTLEGVPFGGCAGTIAITR